MTVLGAKSFLVLPSETLIAQMSSSVFRLSRNPKSVLALGEIIVATHRGRLTGPALS